MAQQLTSRNNRAALASEPPTVRLAAPSLRGVIRIMLVLIACAIGLYLA
jgi:hypothetical protein